MGQVDGARHLRAAPRYKVFQPTEMRGADGVKRVHLLNLSVGGALVHADEAPALGTVLSVRCGGALISARVAWAAGRRFGVAFDTTLAHSVVERVLSDHHSLVTSASRRIGSLA